ncbi:hypothetical protein ACN4EE_14650 [Geminocystis sp. CENA526]|uniref:hypothetical protein n=1 Tax=Geminocystis sp. CENA526 TaxID=1355871 RepID=UPI003D6FC2F1
MVLSLFSLISLFMGNLSAQGGEARIRGSAAFYIDENDNVRGVTVGVSVGKNDAFSQSFFDPNTNRLSTVSVGSAGTITVTDETETGIGTIQDSLDPNPSQPQTRTITESGEVTIGSQSGTASLELDAP